MHFKNTTVSAVLQEINESKVKVKKKENTEHETI